MRTTPKPTAEHDTAPSRALGSVLEPHAISVHPDARVADTWISARDAEISHVPVARDGCLVGIIGVSDLRRAPTSAPIVDFMHTDVVTSTPDMTLREVAAVMKRERVNTLPVLARDDDDEPELLGVVTSGDLMRAGLPAQQVIGERRCVACGTHHEVRVDTTHGAPFCAECLDRAGPPNAYVDIGRGGQPALS